MSWTSMTAARDCRVLVTRQCALAIVVGVILFSLTMGGAAPTSTLQVWAAASLTEALTEIGTRYEEKTGQRVSYNFAASSLLARQIESGAPADIFFSADEAKMDHLQALHLIRPETRTKRLSNQLVLIVNREQPAPINSMSDLRSPGIERIAIAEPNTVPAGIYAKAYLSAQGLWSTVESKIIPTQNVRGTLAAVESGNVDAGFVYLTDAKISRGVRVVYRVPNELGPEISYPAAILRDTKRFESARRFMRYLDSPVATTVFTNHGFSIPSTSLPHP